MSLLWLYFVSGLCKPQVPNDVVAVYNLEFVQLPWQQLLPNIHVMESMASVSINEKEVVVRWWRVLLLFRVIFTLITYLPENTPLLNVEYECDVCLHIM